MTFSVLMESLPHFFAACFCGKGSKAERAFNKQLEREREACECPEEFREVRRERDRMRQRNSCLYRKYGLKGQQER